MVKPWEPLTGNSPHLVMFKVSEKVKFRNKYSYSAIQRAAIVHRSKNLVMKRRLHSSEYEKYSNREQQREGWQRRNRGEEEGPEWWLAT